MVQHGLSDFLSKVATRSKELGWNSASEALHIESDRLLDRNCIESERTGGDWARHPCGGGASSTATCQGFCKAFTCHSLPVLQLSLCCLRPSPHS
jgi:hypothetical protein